jgi:hypothetical protein
MTNSIGAGQDQQPTTDAETGSRWPLEVVGFPPARFPLELVPDAPDTDHADAELEAG